MLPGLAFVLGAMIGSFLNVVIHRLPRDESIVHPSSHCPGCQRPIRWWNNVPILSYLWLRGRCAGCAMRISPRYPAVEAVTGLVFAGLAARYGWAAATPLWMAFAAALIAAAVIDYDHQIIPDEISLGGLVAGLVLMPVVQVIAETPLRAALVHSAGGALLGGGLLWSVGFAHARISTAFGRTFEHWPGDGAAHPRPASLDYWTWFPGLGFGDVKLLAMIGAFVGPSGVIHALVLASALGLVFGVLWALAVRSWSSPFGFGPALAAGALAWVLFPFQLPVL